MSLENMMVAPMKANNPPKKKNKTKNEVLLDICDNGDYFALIKEDGAWYSFIKGESECALYSRALSVKTNFYSEKIGHIPHIKEYLNSILPNNTILVGEIYYPNGNSAKTTEIMGCDEEKALTRQNGEWGFIHYYIFDILMYDGESLLKHTNKERLAYLEKVKCLIDEHPYIRTAEPYFYQGKEMYDFLMQLLKDGKEGAILRNKNAYYIPDKKPTNNWIKVKQEDKADVICMGFENPTKLYVGKEPNKWTYKLNGELVTKSYYNNWVGSMIVGAYNNEGVLVELGTVSSGFSDLVLEEMTLNKDYYIGKPLLIECMEISKDATFRHARFKHWRIEDISPKDCTVKKMLD